MKRAIVVLLSGFAILTARQAFPCPPMPYPYFLSDPVIKTDAMEDATYSGSIANDAYSLFTKSFSKLSHTGPGGDWVTIGSNGSLSGTPALAHVGQHTWGVRVTNPFGYDDALLQITVQPFHFICGTIVLPWEDGGSTSVIGYLAGSAGATWQATGSGVMESNGLYHFGSEGEIFTITATKNGVNRQSSAETHKISSFTVFPASIAYWSARKGVPSAGVCDTNDGVSGWDSHSANSVTLMCDSSGQASVGTTVITAPEDSSDLINYFYNRRLHCTIWDYDRAGGAQGPMATNWGCSDSQVVGTGDATDARWYSSRWDPVQQKWSTGCREFKIQLFVKDRDEGIPGWGIRQQREVYVTILPRFSMEVQDHYHQSRYVSAPFATGTDGMYIVNAAGDHYGHFLLDLENLDSAHLPSLYQHILYSTPNPTGSVVATSPSPGTFASPGMACVAVSSPSSWEFQVWYDHNRNGVIDDTADLYVGNCHATVLDVTGRKLSDHSAPSNY